MSKITLLQFRKIMEHDVLSKRLCIEISFFIDDDGEYASCWTGKLPSSEGVEVYWFGLVPDGSQAYRFESLDELLNEGVFRGQSIIELWGCVTIDTIDNLDAENRLPYYLD